jgi:hypothetical protein
LFLGVEGGQVPDWVWGRFRFGNGAASRLGWGQFPDWVGDSFPIDLGNGPMARFMRIWEGLIKFIKILDSLEWGWYNKYIIKGL